MSRVPLKTDSSGRILVIIRGGLAWVVDKLGRFMLLPPAQLGRHADWGTDPTFNIGWDHEPTEKGH